MSQARRVPVLDDMIALLVSHFGYESVSAALARLDRNPPVSRPGHTSDPSGTRGGEETSKAPTVAERLSALSRVDVIKHDILSGFYARLTDRQVLGDAQDISQFAQVIGLKHLVGRSRREKIPSLMRFLLDQPTERLSSMIAQADGISEEQRRQGFSVLTDKLLRDK